jgi:5-methylcytosine-specific restriction endonuclease McrA
VSPFRYCIERGCFAVAEPGKSRCAEHRRRPVPRDQHYRRMAASIRAIATTCAICGQPASASDGLHVDHIVPRVDGGSDDPSNLRAVHASCSLKRGSRP